MAKQLNNRNNGNTFPRLASTDFQVGDFVAVDGAGAVIPSAGGDDLVGICNEEITSATPLYASSTPLNISEALYNDEFEIPVITGSAAAALIGTKVDVDPTDPRGVDVSGAGTQILITEVIDAATVVGKIAQRA